MNSIQSEIKRILLHYTTMLNLDYDLLYAQIKVESNFDPKAKSQSGQIGLFQIKPDTFQDIKDRVQNLYNMVVEDTIWCINTNIKAGCLYMKWLYDSFNSYYYAFLAYNQGYGLTKDLINWRHTGQSISGQQVEYVYKIYKEAGLCPHL